MEKQLDIILCHFRFPRAEWRLCWTIFRFSSFVALPKQQYGLYFKEKTKINIYYIFKCTDFSLCSLNLLPCNKNFSACVVFVRSCLSLIAHPFPPALNRPRSSLHFSEHLPRESAGFLWEVLETSQNTGFRAQHLAFALVYYFFPPENCHIGTQNISVYLRHPISNKLMLSPSIVEMFCLEVLAWILVGGFVSFFSVEEAIVITPCKQQQCHLS